MTESFPNNQIQILASKLASCLSMNPYLAIQSSLRNMTNKRMVVTVNYNYLTY